jgi:thioredoxin 1
MSAHQLATRRCAGPRRVARKITPNSAAVNEQYAAVEPTRAQVDALAGATMLEFGSPSCGYCLAAQTIVAAALAGHPHVRHIKIADGRGRPLGRSFGIRLWPTLVFMCDGSETGRIIRPTDAESISYNLEQIDGAR